MTDPSPDALARACYAPLRGVPLQVTRLPGGGNNRIYRVQAPGHDVVLKHYFRHPDRPRDRLGAEFSFLKYAWGAGARCIPEPLARDDAEGVGIYSFLPGRPLVAAEVGHAEIGQAAGFIEFLNGSGRAAASSLTEASEACFSVEAHLRLVDGRVDRLKAIAVGDDVGAMASRLVEDSLLPAWRRIRADVEDRLGNSRLPWAGDLAAPDRIVSPSDFGFHNALRGADGGLFFVDFEHAGWDDPAKLACDFFLQPALPPSRVFLAATTRRFASLARDPDGAYARAELLWPVLAIKWCCILLNHFSAVDLARRTFASAEAASARNAQLGKARRLLEELTSRKAP